MEKGYSYIIDETGTLIAHEKREFVFNQRNFIQEAETDLQFTLLADMFKKMIGEKPDLMNIHLWDRIGVSDFPPFPTQNGPSLSGLIRQTYFKKQAMRFNIAVTSVICLMAGIFLADFDVRNIVLPIKACVRFTGLLAEGTIPMMCLRNFSNGPMKSVIWPTCLTFS